ncbi:flagellar hook protein FlgE [Chelativorans salis]|uniref:Flagellar hook protein FlgE n=1 Tax=Chelativorans salis TaxID=2978478 RepID=A0ABT2LUM7_9HYPH|nr:flagellar hook protein FlgE [Chelativorans sp. EGI FJ00035]MCT7377562.1 flagellar hook protein FlgE [Chelativorans sp. EGI FJ00035]
MSLYGMMRTGVSGMNGQANRLSTVADNIANSSTNGYKRAKTEFSTLVVPSTSGSYNSGGVTTSVRNLISTQGVLQYTTSVTDLAVEGDGFFVVQDSGGQPYLTRAGSFVLDGEGRLVNAAGFQLMGYSYANGAPAPTANGYAGLEPVTITQAEIVATPSRNGVFAGNLPLDADVVADLPSGNTATAQYSAKTSLVAYGNRGEEVLLDVYFTKTADDTWEVAVFDRADAAADTSFPYASGPLATETLTFDATTGKLTGPTTGITIPVPGGDNLDLDLSSLTQLDSAFAVADAKVDGTPPSGIESVEIGTDGIVYAQYSDGSFRPLYRIPLATVPSPDQLQVVSGNVFAEGANSGAVRIGLAGEAGLGKIVSGALENSNVDIAQELTDMIESQRSYTANSKVFQTGSELMELLVNLKR